MSTTVLNARLRVPKVKAIRRPRLDDLLDSAWQHRLTMVLAPAGSGKTTAVAGFALRSPHTVGWFAATGCDGSVASFVSYVNSSLRNADDRIDSGWATVDDIATSLEQLDDQIGLVVDDVHTLSGTPAERSLAELIDRAPEQFRIVLAGRREPGFDLSRLRLAGQVLILGSDELRFRSWEAEQLFRELYETWLRPDDIARLAHRVDGWAAGLQLFHLAARNLPPTEQRRLIDRLSGQARLVRDYLAANVLEPIPAELRTFLIDTCVLGVVTPALADELRAADGSAEHLRSLATGHLFTVVVDDDTYRYHEVLRAQLEVLLHERDGPMLAAERFRVAAALLERDGFIYDALRCYAHAGDWEALRRIASPSAGELPPARSHWVAEVPPSIVADDPWLLLARARAEIAGGQLRAAVATFAEAQARSVGSELAEQCRAQRAQLAALLDPGAHAAEPWLRRIRVGLRQDPLGAALDLDAIGTPMLSIAAGVLRLAGGDADGCIATLTRALGDESISEGGFAVGLVVLALAQLLLGRDDRQPALDEAETRAERAGVGWAARLARAGLALTTRRAGGLQEAARVADLCRADGDPWGEGFAALFGGIGATRAGSDASPMLRRAASAFQALDAPVFAGISLNPSAFSAAAYRVGQVSPAALDFAVVDAAAVGPNACAPDGHLPDSVPSTAASPRVAVSGGAAVGAPGPSIADRRLSVVPAVQAMTTPVPNMPPPLEVRCLGAFELLVDGVEISLAGLRPRARTLLRLLAINIGGSIHRETLVEALWPESDADTGVHNLQVAVSAVRKTLADAGVANGLGVVRHGEAYRLALHRVDACDHARFLDDVKRAKSAVARGDDDAALAAAMRALHDYRGDLLSDDGPVEWVQQARLRAATQREAAAVIAANLMVARSTWGEAIELCEAVINERPYADELWRLLVQAQRERGDLAAAAQAQARYDRMLAGLNS